MSSEQQERKAFEAMCVKRWRGDRDALTRNAAGEYITGPVEFAWQSWWARATHPAPVVSAPAQGVAKAAELTKHDLEIIKELEAIAADPQNDFWPAMIAIGANRLMKKLLAAPQPAQPTTPAPGEASQAAEAAGVESETLSCGHPPWLGYEEQTITHPFFGDKPVEVYAIRVAPLPAAMAQDKQEGSKP